MPLFNLKSKRGVAISRKGEFFYEYLLPDDSIFVLVEESVDVQVNAHLAYLTIVICIAFPIIEGVAMLVLSRIIVFLLQERLALNVRLQHQVCGGVEAVVALDSDTCRVIFCYLPVEPQIIVNPIVLEMVPGMRILIDVQNVPISRQVV